LFMEFKSKKYKFSKIKNYIKTNNFFIFYNGNNLNLKNWIIIEQQLKYLKLDYYKTYNTVTKKILENSIYVNFKPLINGLILLIKPNKKTKVHFKNLINLNTVLIPIGIKTNKNFYNTVQLKNFYSLEYQINIAILVNSLKTSLKIPSKLIQPYSKLSK
jgi:hypothetical protein